MYDYINLDYIDLMTDGDADMKVTMLEMLPEEMTNELKLMREHLAKENWEDLFRAAHKMKSTLAFVGNGAMTEANLAIEHKARHEEDLGDIPAHLEVVENTCIKAINEIHNAIAAVSN